MQTKPKQRRAQISHMPDVQTIKDDITTWSPAPQYRFFARGVSLKTDYSV